MTEYKLEIKQIVDYPKCRIYRQFIQSLIADRSIRTNGCSGLFHYAVLCCYANFRTSYHRYDGISYIVHPGQWICPLRELRTWFRVRTNRQLLRHLDSLQRHHLIEYDLIGRGQLVQYRILDWPRYNTVLDYSCPCQKDSGFFFLPMSAASRLLSLGKCSEMDTLLDLWLNAIYNDHQVAGSEAGPVVYLRNGTGSPLVSYAELGKCCTTCPRFQYRLYPLSDCVGVLWEHETEELRLGLMLPCGGTQTRYFELTIRQKGANDNGEE